MGSGVPPGPQNQCKELEASQVGSIPTYSRQEEYYFLNYESRNYFGSLSLFKE